MSNFEPSGKSEQVDELLTKLTGKDRRATIMTNQCVTCERGLLCRACRKEASAKEHSPLTPRHHYFMPFRDSLSIREYQISGMCQECQDEVFGRETDE